MTFGHGRRAHHMSHQDDEHYIDRCAFANNFKSGLCNPVSCSTYADNIPVIFIEGREKCEFYYES